MKYYCFVCKKTISKEVFQFSMNKYHKALCGDHQRSIRLSGTTKGLQNLVRSRHKDEGGGEVPKLVTIKDWIKADLDTWDKALKNESDEPYIIKSFKEANKQSSLKQFKK